MNNLRPKDRVHTPGYSLGVQHPRPSKGGDMRTHLLVTGCSLGVQHPRPCRVRSCAWPQGVRGGVYQNNRIILNNQSILNLWAIRGIGITEKEKLGTKNFHNICKIRENLYLCTNYAIQRTTPCVVHVTWEDRSSTKPRWHHLKTILSPNN